jgi:membrane-bound metal-dependent hydrolase YbcI (DUF457 family)
VAANVATFLACTGVTLVATLYGMHWAWVGASYAIGVAAHIAGDVMTREGVPLFFPVSKHRFSATRMPTGGRREQWLVAVPVGIVITTLTLWQLGAMPYLFAILAGTGVSH